MQKSAENCLNIGAFWNFKNSIFTKILSSIRNNPYFVVKHFLKSAEIQYTDPCVGKRFKLQKTEQVQSILEFIRRLLYNTQVIGPHSFNLWLKFGLKSPPYLYKKQKTENTETYLNTTESIFSSVLPLDLPSYAILPSCKIYA